MHGATGTAHLTDTLPMILYYQAQLACWGRAADATIQG